MKLISALLAICMALPAAAQIIDDVFSLSVRPGWRAPDSSHMAGLQIQLAPGWKTYWRQPGAAGIPPLFDWAGSENIKHVEILWPQPKVAWILGQRSIGYYDDVVFPIRITPKNDGPISLNGTIQLGVCEEICIPVMVQLSTLLPNKANNDVKIAQAMNAQIPMGRGSVTCEFSPGNGATQVQMIVPKLSAVQPEVVVEVGVDQAWVAEPTLSPAPKGWHAETEVLVPSGQPVAIERSTVRTTVFYGDQAFEYQGCVSP